MPKIYDENGIATEIDEATYFSLEDLPGEEWKDIFYFDERRNQWVDFRFKYQISNKGRVKSLLRHDTIGRILPERILKVCSDNTVILSYDNISHRVSGLSIMTLLRNIEFTIPVNDTLRKGKFKKIICTTTEIVYPNSNQAMLSTGVSDVLIRECCKHRRKFAGRLVDGKIVDGRKYRNQGEPLVWRYLDEYEG